MKTRVFKFRIPAILLITFILTFLACEKSQNKLVSGSVIIGTPVFISLLKEYRITDNLSFSIDSINDYRCPMRVECFWSGDVDLLFNIRHNGIQTDTLIHALTNRNNPFIAAGYKWEVIEVSPWPSENRKILPEEYQIEILISDN